MRFRNQSRRHASELKPLERSAEATPADENRIGIPLSRLFDQHATRIALRLTER